MEVSSLKKLSLDTNVLFDLAQERDYAHDFRETFQRRGYTLLIAPTVVAELYFFLEHGSSAEEKLASTSIRNIVEWDIQTIPLSLAQSAKARLIAKRLSASGMLPPEEFNDALILTESAVAEIPILVSSDNHLLDLDPEKLRAICLDAAVLPISTAHPRRLLRALG